MNAELAALDFPQDKDEFEVFVSNSTRARYSGNGGMMIYLFRKEADKAGFDSECFEDSIRSGMTIRLKRRVAN